MGHPAGRPAAGGLTALLLLQLNGTAAAQDAPNAQATQLGPVVVTATRTGRDPFEVPASIDAVSAETLDANKFGVSLAEAMATVPGVQVRDRQDYAQDVQVSVRGFGARAQFGIVGVKLFVDGVPATMPDGSGQASHFNLESADRIEALRGPFSALYGNSSGGVIQIFTTEGTAQTQLETESVGGSYGSWRSSVDARGLAGPMSYSLDYTHFSTDGYRDHSRARRDSGNARFGFSPMAGNRLTLVANTVSIPDALDQGALTRAQFEADPSQAAPTAVQFNTRKSTAQSQVGLTDEQQLGGGNSIRAMGYYGNRIVKQYQAIAVGAQNPPTSPGGVIDLHNDYYGGDLRFIHRDTLFGGPFTLVAGMAYDRLDSDRRGWNNYIGPSAAPTALGVQGNLRRDETNTLYNLDEYLQADWTFAPRWSAFLGARHTQLNLDSEDHYITTGNGNDSGAANFGATTPVAGLLFRATPRMNVYADYGQGFDTPTFDNLSYRPDGQPGLNLTLQPARTGTGELGMKLKLGQDTRFNLAVFRSITRDEIVVASTSGGRSTFQNAGRTRRQGVELGYDASLGKQWRAQLAYTYLDARYRESYKTCTTSPTVASCTTPNTTIPADNRIPGVAQSMAFGALRWGGDVGFDAAMEVTYLGNIMVNDTNTAGAPSYGLLGLNGGYTWDLPKTRVKTFVRLDNLTRNDYVAAVVINDRFGQYYQPGSGRAIFGGVAVSFKP